MSKAQGKFDFSVHHPFKNKQKKLKTNNLQGCFRKHFCCCYE